MAEQEKKEKKEKIPRQAMPEQDPKERSRNFKEVPYGYTPEMAQKEAQRCLQCKKPKCVEGCPVGVKIPEFVKLIAEGDFIGAAGEIGTVEAVHIFTTILVTPDNKTVIIPNAKLTGDNIVNYSAKGTRRVDLVVGVAYDEDLQKARRMMPKLLVNPDNRGAVLRQMGELEIRLGETGIGSTIWKPRRGSSPISPISRRWS